MTKLKNEIEKGKEAANRETFYRGEGGSNVAQGKALLAEGRHFAMDSEYPKGFGKVSEYILKSDAKVLDLGDSTFSEISQKLGIPEKKYISPKELSRIAKEKGYDVLKYSGEYKSTGKPFTHTVELTENSFIKSQPLQEKVSPLIQEAKKGETFYHVTTQENAASISKTGFSGNVGEMSKASHGDMQKGVFLYDEKQPTETFGKNFERVGKKPVVLETKVEGKIYDANTQTKYGWEDELQTQEIASNKKIIDQLRKDGYVGVKSTELGTNVTFVFEPKTVKVSQPLQEVRKIPKELQHLSEKARGYQNAIEFYNNEIKPLDSYAPEYRNPIIDYWRKSVMKPLEEQAILKGVTFSTNPMMLENNLDGVLENKYTTKQLANMSVRQKSEKVLGNEWSDKYQKDVLERGSPLKIIQDFYENSVN